MIGSILGGFALKKFGRRHSYMIASTISLVGVSITLVDSVTAICVGRVIWGIACGLFTVIDPRFIDEVAPQ